jgi:hypothetical protein
MRDAPCTVSRLEGQIEIRIPLGRSLGPVEACTEALEHAYALRSLLDADFHRQLVAQSRTRAKRVGDVSLE